MHAIHSLDGDGEIGVSHFGLYASGPFAFGFGAVVDDFHAVVFHACIGVHIFIVDFHTKKDAKLAVGDALGEVGFGSEARRRAEAFDFTYFCR